MSTLRGVLLVFAVLLLAGIYWWGWRSDRKRRVQNTLSSAPSDVDPYTTPSSIAVEEVMRLAPPQIESTRIEPTLDEPVVVKAPDTDDPVIEPAAAIAPDPPPTKIIALRLVAATPRFSGAHLRTVLETEALAFGKYQIFHRSTPEGSILFSVASMLEPGSFDLEQMFHQQYPGIVLFAQLPTVVDGVSVLNDLISCARQLQQNLGGELQDEQGMPLLPLRIEQLRREVRDFAAAAASPFS